MEYLQMLVGNEIKLKMELKVHLGVCCGTMHWAAPEDTHILCWSAWFQYWLLHASDVASCFMYLGDTGWQLHSWVPALMQSVPCSWLQGTDCKNSTKMVYGFYYGVCNVIVLCIGSIDLDHLVNIFFSNFPQWEATYWLTLGN